MNKQEKAFLAQFEIEVDDNLICVRDGDCNADVNHRQHLYCCGVREIGDIDVGFDTEEELKDLLTALSLVIQNLNAYYHDGRSIAVTSDNEHGYLWKMRTENEGWLQGNIVTNTNSGNMISMFEIKVNPR